MTSKIYSRKYNRIQETLTSPRSPPPPYPISIPFSTIILILYHLTSYDACCGISLPRLTSTASQRDPNQCSSALRHVLRPHSPCYIKLTVSGQIITHCTVPGTIALTFDDGPSAYTTQLLSLLSSHDIHATFFIIGNDPTRGPIFSPPWSAILQQMYVEGHQIASHSWMHQDFSALGVDGAREEIVKNEDAFKSVIGVVPTYFRCPYLRCGAASSLLTDFGYRVVDVSIDTKDYENNDASMIAVSKNKFQAELGWEGQGGGVVLAHDIHYQTVASLAEYMIMLVEERGLMTERGGTGAKRKI